MADRAGQQLGSYRLQRLLGRGGFAEVYLGEHIHLGTLAAIKVLSAKLQSEESERFREEARTIARLKHPHIVKVLDFGVENGVPFLVMEYAVNGTLRQRHPRGTRLPPATILPYVRQVAGALQYAHERKLIHRDVKPENMLVDESGEVLLSDFGLALVAQSSRYHSTQDAVGTLAYMAPEQIQAHPRPASDQYSLGIVIYEWLAGERPFHGSMSEVIAKHISVPPPPLREKRPDLSPALEQVVLTALEKDPKARFASIQAFATAFENACQAETSFLSPSIQRLMPSLTPLFSGPSLPPLRPEKASFPLTPLQPARTSELPAQSSPPAVAVPPTQPLPPAAVPSDRTPSAGWSAAPLAPPPVEAVWASAESSIRRTPTPPEPVTQPASGISRRALLIGGALTGLAAIGGGYWLVHLQKPLGSSFAARATASHTARPITGPPTATPLPLGTTLYTYTGHSEWVDAVAWSPNGQRITSGSFDKTVQVWDASDGSNVFTYTGHSDSVEAVAWSPDGQRIASGSGDSTVQVWDASDGSNVFTYTGHSYTVNAVAWSPDGKRIASGSNDNTVQVWDASNGGNVFTYTGHSDEVFAVAWSPDGKRIASGSYDKSVRVWTSNGSNVFTYRGHSDFVSGVAWSPDGKRIASVSKDKTVQVWDASNGGNVFTYIGHSDWVIAVAWSPDGKRIASGSNDSTVQVWDASNGGNVFTYGGHAGGVWSVAWSPDGKYIASGSPDETVQVWVAS